MKILHGLTGSVASKLNLKFAAEYRKLGLQVNYMQTKSADNFTNASIGATLTYDDDFEWSYYHTRKKVLHIELVKSSDVLVIAPCSANTLAKIANGICDNLVTCVARAWDFKKPFIIAPAMNTQMWLHPVTIEHLSKIESWGIKVIWPVEKTLFCGDVGIGAMAEIQTIIDAIGKATNTTFVTTMEQFLEIYGSDDSAEKFPPQTPLPYVRVDQPLPEL